MRRRVLVPLLLLLAFSVTGCATKSTKPSDVVEQPTELDGVETNDPTVSDQPQKDALAQCVGGSPVSGRSLRVVTTVAPITNLVSMIAGNTGTKVQGLVPEGTNSHTFDPPPSAAATLESADIVFLNGLNLEDPTKELADANAKNAVICEIGTAALPPSGYLFDSSFPKDAGKPNPHLWTNPPMVLSYLTIIRDALAAVDPANIDTFDANYVKMSALVVALDDAMTTASGTVAQVDRQLLTYHDSFAYFSKHYKYEIIGAIQPSSFEEPSPSDVARLIDQVKATGVRAIFGSEVFPSPVLAQIGKETGVRYIDTLRDDDLPGKPGDPDHSWAGLMKFDFVTMIDALGGDSSALKKIDVDVKIPDKAVYPQ